MEIADVFYLLGSIFMTLLIILLGVILFMLFYLKKKVSDITQAFQQQLNGGVVSWLVSLIAGRSRK
jgi:hypothetical protein